MPHYEHTVEVGTSPEHVFAILDDTRRTPEWLTRCTGIDKVSDGPNQVGTQLVYHYKQGGRAGQMDGRITVHESDRHIAMNYVDKSMDVTVDFVTAPGPTEGTTMLRHTIDITTKGFQKVFTPLINRALPKQTLDAMAMLKALAERG